MRNPRIVITSGEPAGIGPDICVMLAQSDCGADLVVAADPELIESAARTLGLPLELDEYRAAAPREPHRRGRLKILAIPCRRPVVAGRLDAGNAPYVLQMLDRACDGCMSGEFAALVTAPVQKSVLMESGADFSGHTEYLAARTGAALPVMMLVDERMRVALVTTHLPLAEVPGAITAGRLLATLRIVHADLGRRFGVPAPRIAVLGLNPHAGESGHLGREEIEVLEPAIHRARSEGIDARGPLPADTAFARRALDDVDVVLAMYHDQGLPVIKHASFGDAVNVTLGLPIIRTSVDHGTALALARSGRADPGSLRTAVALAAKLAATEAAVAGS
ncbi:MAG: 4-hydroxythreonine-4-phosphate dehydrogenase PdxA [Gammaproteobacteria bacterium]|nr:4-hydroxythreonine-4-phosphate dehydrogenase PdxA [Gammaproteobacteria bacterium]